MYFGVVKKVKSFLVNEKRLRLHYELVGKSMKDSKIVWLASYPRSGNTYLRTILWQCFGLRSISVYPNDLGGNKLLEDYVGHIEREQNKPLPFLENDIPLVKTHENNKDDYPAIYIIRDGRAACVSLWQFYKGNISLDAVIAGQHRFGTWSSHVLSWNPWERPNTLLLRYEDMRDNLPAVLNTISEFLKRDILTSTVPDRNAIARVDGQWVKAKKSWRSELTGDQLKRFNQINKSTLRKAGYLD